MRRIAVVLVLALAASPSASSQATQKEADESKAVRELIELDKRLADATRLKDRATLESIYADDFILVNRRGEVWDKKRNIAFLMSEGLTFEAMTSEDHTVKVFGETAHMFHRGSARGARDGKPFSGSGRAFHIFARRGGRWQVLVTHEGLGEDK
jgi:ketosteroid isomerase-like protein